MAGWTRFIRIALGVYFGALAALTLLVLAMNPYGNLPVSLFKSHAIMDINQRFQYPAVIRSGHYDSLVIGTSTARLLPPALLEGAFGGRFANLAMNSGMAWEQYRLADLFLREVERPRTLLVGLDRVWCSSDADVERITARGFPEWMYDGTVWTDLPYMLNGKTVEISLRRLGHALGLQPARLSADGYDVFTPPEADYDAAKARAHIWGTSGPRPLKAQTPPYRAGAGERARWRFPALDWLDEIAARWPGDKLLVFVPVHAAAQPVPGSRRAARLAECKARIARIASRHEAHLVDFLIHSPLTTSDVNYWDALHYRLPIADRIIAGVAKAAATARDDPRGEWHYLAGPAAGADVRATLAR